MVEQSSISTHGRLSMTDFLALRRDGVVQAILKLHLSPHTQRTAEVRSQLITLVPSSETLSLSYSMEPFCCRSCLPWTPCSTAGLYHHQERSATLPFKHKMVHYCNASSCHGDYHAGAGPFHWTRGQGTLGSTRVDVTWPSDHSNHGWNRSAETCRVMVDGERCVWHKKWYSASHRTHNGKRFDERVSLLQFFFLKSLSRQKFVGLYWVNQPIGCWTCICVMNIPIANPSGFFRVALQQIFRLHQ